MGGRSTSQRFKQCERAGSKLSHARIRPGRKTVRRDRRLKMLGEISSPRANQKNAPKKRKHVLTSGTFSLDANAASRMNSYGRYATQRILPIVAESYEPTMAALRQICVRSVVTLWQLKREVTVADGYFLPAAATDVPRSSISSQSIPCPVPSPRKRMRRFFWLALRCRIASRRRSLGYPSRIGGKGSSRWGGQPSSSKAANMASCVDAGTR